MNMESRVLPVVQLPNERDGRFDEEGFGITDFLQILRIRRALIVGVALTVLAITAAVTYQLTPLYTGSTMVILDQRKNNITDMNSVMAGLPADQATVQNQIQILQSRSLLEHVINKAKLKGDREFNPAKGGGLSSYLGRMSLLKWFPAQVNVKTPGEQDRDMRDQIVSAIQRRMEVDPVGLSQAIQITVRTTDPERSERVANAIADAYVEDQLNTKFEATQKTTKWLADRLQQLNGQVQAADAAVAQYRADNNLTETVQGGSIVDQQLGDLNTQLIVARSNLAEQNAKLGRVRELQRAGRSADVTQVVDSPLINQLRGQETELLRREAEFSSKYGSRHPMMIDLQSQKQNLDAKITQEVNRVVQTVANEVAVAGARVGSLQGSLNRISGESGVQNQARVKLKQLEANATSTRSLYEAFLQRFKQTEDQDGIQTPDARILTRAQIAASPSFPNKKLISGAAIPLSLLLGFLAGLLAERLDNGFRTTAQVENQLRLPVLATVPELTEDGESPVTAVINKPLSAYAEAIRGIQLGLVQSHLDNPPKVILVTSSAPGEGKTTVALSLARQCARKGRRVVLVDGDLRRPSLADTMALKKNAKGIVEAMTGAAPLDECLHKDPRSDLFVLPSTIKAVNPPDLLGSGAMSKLIAALRSTTDMVIIDSAPLLPVNDTKILADLADTVLFVVRWEKTPRDAAVAAIRSLTDLDVPIAGVVMTRTNVTRHQYYNYGYQSYANYASYYNN